VTAQWISAISTGGALLVVIVLFGFQTWDRIRDHGERRRAQAERPLGEASLAGPELIFSTVRRRPSIESLPALPRVFN
jgi:hypothetical protein